MFASNGRSTDLNEMAEKMTESKSLSLASMISRGEQYLFAAIDNELVLMDAEQGKYYGLDAIGADIWQRLEGRVVVSDLCAALGKEYDADADTISRDVLALLERLAAEGLIEVSP